jgi:chemosensory pili system protein ChpA (sensor histidine kinase/response regulator)
MSEAIDHGTLRWVKQELDETLKQARQALEAFVETPEDESQMRFCAAHLHQVRGTLQMVEIYGAALLAEEMEQLASVLVDGKLRQRDDAVSVLIRAILQLPDYLERLMSGGRDLPLVLLPLLNDLRAARGESLLSENAMFSPEIDRPLPPGLCGEGQTDSQAVAKQVRHQFQIGLLGWYKDQDSTESLARLTQALEALQRASETETVGRLWWVAGGLVDALGERALPVSLSAKLLLGQIDRQVKRLIDEGEQGIESDFPRALFTNLLFYVAQSKDGGERNESIRSTYQLADLLPDDAELEAARESLSGRNVDLLRTVAAAVKENLARVKDGLDLFQRSGFDNQEQLAVVADTLKSIGDTLGMLGLGAPRKEVLQRAELTRAILAGEREASEADMMEVASSLLFVENAMDGLAGGRSVEAESAEDAEFAQVMGVVLQEAITDMARAKEAITRFMEDHSDLESLKRVPQLFNQVKGGLLLLGREQAAGLVDSVNRYVQRDLLNRSQEPEQTAMDTLADAICGIEYYLEGQKESRLFGGTVMQVATDAVARLGCPTEGGGAAVIQGAALPAAISAEEPAALPAELQDSGSGQELEPAFPLPEEAAESVDALDTDEQIEDMMVEAFGEPEVSPEPAIEPEAPAETEAPSPGVGTSEAAGDLPVVGEDVDDEILEIFIEEAEEEVARIRELVPKWIANPEDQEPLIEFRRSFHTLKGSGRLVGAMVIGEFAWAFESMLNRVIDGTIVASDELFDVLQRGTEVLPALVEQVKGSGAPEQDIARLQRQAEAVGRGQALTEAGPGAAAPEPASASSETTQVDVDSAVAVEESTGEETAAEAGQLMDPVLYEIFFKETAGHLETVGRFIAHCRSQGDVCEMTEELVRALHTLHGSARMAGADPIAELAASLERYGKSLMGEQIAMSGDALGLLEEAAGEVERILDQLRGPSPEIGDLHALIDRIEALPRTVDDVEDSLWVASEEGQPITEESALPSSTETEAEGSDATDTEASVPIDKPPQEATADRLPVVGEDLDEEILEIFLEEAEEELQSLRQHLPLWLDDPDAQDSLVTARRSFHTLKGSGRLIGAMSIGEFAWAFENLLNRVIDGTVARSDLMSTLLGQGLQLLPELIEEVRSGTCPAANPRVLEQAAHTLARGESLQWQGAAEVPEAAEIDTHTPQAVAETQGSSAPAPEWEEPVELAPGPVAQPASEGPVPGEVDVDAATSEAAEQLTDPSASEPSWDETTSEELAPPTQEPHLEPEPVEAPEARAADGEQAPTLENAPDERSPAEASDAQVADPYAEIDPELLAVFLEEADEILHHSESTLHRWLESPADGELMAEYQRHLHTLKGGARMAGISAVGDLAHGIESMLQAVVDGEAVVSQPMFDLLWRVQDQLTQMVEAIKHRQPVRPAEDIFCDLESVVQESSPVGSTEALGAEFPSEHVLPAEDDGSAASADDYEDVDSELMAVFLEEGDEILESSEVTLQRWADAPENFDLMAQLQRELHTLKGGARMAGFTKIGDLSHGVESLVEAFSTDRKIPPRPVFQALQKAHDRLVTMQEQVRNRQPIEPAGELIRELHALRPGAGPVLTEALELGAGPEANKSEPLPEGGDRRAEPRTQQELVRVRADLLDNLVNFAGEISIYRSRLEQQVGGYRFNLSEMDQTIARLRNQLRQMEMETEAQILSRHQDEIDEYGQDFDPLEMDRYSTMQQLSRSLAESVNDLASIQGHLDILAGESETLLLQQSRVNTELQEGLMRTRMVPFLSLAPRMRRIVRQTAQELNKRAELKLNATHGEMDRTMIDRIIAPIEHMLRNALAHGIELPEERLAKGKPADGVIQVSMSRESSEVVIQIEDDGAGIDLQRVRAKAIERGLMREDMQLSDHEVLQFILETGFSTAQEVSQVAGRGVGMDVVNSEVKQLGGSLQIDAEPGRGTTFTVRLPFTLAINQALLVYAGEEMYAVPISGVEGVVRMRREDLLKFYRNPDERYEYAGYSYEVEHLGRLLGVSEPNLDALPARAPLLLSRTGDHAMAMQVDQLMGSREIVVKSVGPQISTVPGVSGATILGDGSVVLILDLAPLVRLGAWTAPEADTGEPQHVESQAVTVMVVDDSITVRKVTTRLLERNDMQVIAAKDGVDALAKLQDRLPDVMLLDIEMPRMDGFELAQLVRNDSRLRHIPMVMITSRTGDKHRNRAMQIGVNQYLGKPFQEHQLLETIRELLREPKMAHG